ncbi:cobalt transporter subunit CbtB [Natronocella acetinitrilica]|uniref:Cobalt transporter subunit CbtB n=2 Tax=Natronocella acetinitrilica TaxID=414046 RepID=A0AAE3G7P4_9GAMM|nr:CbtB domain-containing protein [Natronocella acetinitrilica]MCP1677214.1 cobalt transporter subunit CbtB [Natronocella acetinitrilica]
MKNQNSVASTSSFDSAKSVTMVPKPVQLAAAVLLGMVILYGAGFANSAVVHDAAHDMRHAAAFPCH